MASRRRSISVPIALTSVAVALSITLLVGWTLIIVQKLEESQAAVASNVSLLVLGILSFVFIMTVLVIFSVFLVREIREVRRQYSFIDSVTHELKSPLASIQLGVETLGRPELEEGQRLKLREMIRSDIDRLAAFIDDVLQASRLPYRREGTDLVALDIPALAARCAAVVTARRGVEPDVVQLDIPPGFEVRSDRAVLEVVLKNLIDNGIKYSGDNPQVSVKAFIEKGRPVIEVRDQGIGIAPKFLKRVFQRFFRVPSLPVNERKGTGLGLYVVTSLVKNLGGRVSVDSAGEGCGATFRVELPSISALREEA